ncbi:MAG: hypothetical protein DHS20C13_27380 [Thermodesulfobacteriota bacterium]|nr:MAG: hypothetical protein DHS20C13_27380 [Thermodesulfobacteriota bacterium]
MLPHILKTKHNNVQIKYNAPSVFVDNEGAIKLSENPVFHQRSAHIYPRYHFSRQCVKLGELLLKRVDTNENIADFLTKPLGPTKFNRFRDKLLKDVTIAR